MRVILLYSILTLILIQPNLNAAEVKTNVSAADDKLLEEQQEMPEPASFISVLLQSSNIMIKWEDSQADSYNIYRSINMISNQDSLVKAELIGKAEKGVQSYLDLNIPFNGDYYYAVVNVNKGKESVTLIPDSNYSTTPVKFIKITVEPKSEAAIEPKEEKKEESAPETAPPVIEKKKVQKAVSKPKIKKRKPYDYSALLDNSIKKYFLKGDYTQSIKEFDNIINSHAPEKIKKKAQLFLGRAYFEIKEYKAAIKMFARSGEYYPDESNFWINNAVKNIK